MLPYINCYATLDGLKGRLGLAGTTEYDDMLLEHLTLASRQIDSFCGRHFWTGAGARYLAARTPIELVLDDDLLSLTELAQDTAWDETFPTLWAASDYDLRPANEPAKWRVMVRHMSSRRFWPGCWRGDRERPEARLTGIWGYGDGRSADPWDGGAGIKVTAADATGTTVTPDRDGLAVGQTIRVGSEQMFVLGVTAGAGRAATVRRGVNGTTAAAHAAGEAAAVALYPALVSGAALWLAAKHFAEADKGHLQQEQLADGRWVYAAPAAEAAMLGVYVAGYRRVAV